MYRCSLTFEITLEVHFKKATEKCRLHSQHQYLNMTKGLMMRLVKILLFMALVAKGQAGNLCIILYSLSIIANEIKELKHHIFLYLEGNCFENGVDYWGNDFKFIDNSDWITCQKACANEPACNYWTLVRSLRKCHLKYTKDIVKHTGNNDIVSAPKYCEGKIYEYPI